MNVTLIGMSGAGKSGAGKLLAKRLGYAFVDTDELIERKSGEPLQSVLDGLGDERFLRLEAGVILAMAGIDGAVIAPGGSVVYSDDAMRFLKRVSVVVWICVPVAVIEARVDPSCRGIVGLKDRTFRELFAEREALYAAAADLAVAPADLDAAGTAELIRSALARVRP